MVRPWLLSPSPSLLLWLTGFHQGVAFYRPGFHDPPRLTRRDLWSKLVCWLSSLYFNLFWKFLHFGILLCDATVSAQPSKCACGGSPQWTSTSYRRNNKNSRSEAWVAFMVYA